MANEKFVEGADELLTANYSMIERSPAPVQTLDPSVSTAHDEATQQLQFEELEKQRLKNVAQATFFGDDELVGEKWEAFSNSWDATWLAKGIDYFKYDAAMFRDTFNEDKEFKANWDEDSVFAFLNQNGLGLEDFNDISEAVSMEHAVDLAELKKIQDERQKQINNALTSGEQLAYSLTTAIADVDVIIGGAGAISAKAIAKTDKTNKIIASVTAGTEMGYGAFIGAIDNDTSMGEAMFMSTIIGAIDYGVVRSLNPKDVSKIADAVADAPNDNAVKAVTDRNIALNTAANETAHPLVKELVDELYLNKPNQAKVKRLMDEIGDFEDLVKGADELETPRLKILTEEINRRIKYGESEHVKALNQTIKDTGTAIKTIESKIEALVKEGAKAGDKKLQRAKKQLIKAQKKEAIALGTSKKMMAQMQKDIVDIASDFEMNIAKVKKDLQEMADNEIDMASEMLDIYRGMFDRGYIKQSTYEQLQASFKKGKEGAYKRPKMEIKPNGVNKEMDVVIDGKKVKKLPYAVGAGLLATTGSAFGYDGEDIVVDAGLIVTAAILGLAGLANAKTIAKHIAGVGSTTKVALARSKTIGARAKISESLDRTRTSLTETIKPLLDNTTGDVKKLVTDIFYNPLDTQKTVERIKNRVYHAHWNNLQKDVQETYKAWLKEVGSSRVEGALSLFSASSKRAEYDKLITEHIEYGYHAEIKSVVEGAKKVNKTLDSMLREMKESGVKDVDKTTLLKNYVPRVTNKSRVQGILANTTEASKEAFIKEFAKMLTKTSSPEAVARVYVEALADPLMGAGRRGMTNIEDIKKVASKHGFGDEIVDDIADALGVGGERFGRLKNRIPMDKRMFKGVTLEYLDGSTSYKATIEDIFEQDIMNVMSDYLNKASGQVAFADMGYKTIDEAYEILHKADIKPEHARTIRDGIDALSGSPIVDYSIPANRIMRDVGNYTIGIKMMFSTLSLAAEALTTAGRLNKSGWRATLQGLTSKLRTTYGDDSFVMGYLTNSDGAGLGIHQYGASFGAYKQIDEFGNVSGGEVGLNVISKLGEVNRDFTLHVLPFVRTSDFLTKVNMQDSLQVMFNHASGKKAFKPYEIKAYAITPRVEELMKRIEVNEKGHVKWFDMDKWGRQDRTDFYTTLDAMLQKRIQQSTMGTTGAWSRNSAIGVVASNLIKFPMSAYSNIGSFLGRGAMDGDAQAMSQIALWFGGSALASIARNEIKGKDYDESDIIMDAILAHPFAGAYGTAVGIMSPAPVKALSDVQDVMNIYNYR